MSMASGLRLFQKGRTQYLSEGNARSVSMRCARHNQMLTTGSIGASLGDYGKAIASRFLRLGGPFGAGTRLCLRGMCSVSF